MEQVVIDYLKKLAKSKILEEEASDCDVMSASGGNFDDAYQLGLDDGEILLARSLLERLGISKD